MRSFTISGLLPALVSFQLTSLVLVAAADDPSLQIEVTKPVTCARKSRNGDILKMNYRGTLQSTGAEFDSSYGKSPFSFRLGAGEVIKGWDQGLLDMCAGEGRKLIIPPKLAYGSRNMGLIPPNSVLVFDTELLEIAGVPPENAVQQNQTPSEPKNTTYSLEGGAKEVQPQKGSEKGPADDSKGNGECKLLGKFAILIQAALGGLALLALVWKRWRERPRRPVLIWFYDVSKQVVGSVLVHFANLFLSMLSSGSLDIKSSAASVGKRKHPNPCSFYLLNLAIDTTIGIPILVFFLYIIHYLFLRTALANPPESISSGNYGNPPNVKWWLKQAFIYFLGLFCMKICVFLLFQIFPWLGWVGDWALRWTEGKEWVQITFVMLIFPLIMNAAQYWIIDNFIKDRSGSGFDFQPVEQHDSDVDDHNENQGLMHNEDEHGVSTVATAEDLDWRENKEAAVLPQPVEFETDDEDHLIQPGSSSSNK